jgi:hypothetical protein
MSDLIETCDNLELRPLEKNKWCASIHVIEYNRKDISSREKASYIQCLCGQSYEAYCKKRLCPCVVLDSPLLSQRRYGTGNFHQPFIITKLNSSRIKDCSDRKIPDSNRRGLEHLGIFLLTHIQID